MTARRLYETALELDKASKATKVPAIARAAAVIRLLGRSATPLGVHPIARELGLMPSTCLYTLRALVAENFVSFDDTTKRYTLDSGLLSLGRNWLTRNSFDELVQPYLDRFAIEWGVVAFGIHIVRLESMIVVAASRTWDDHLQQPPIGTRMPALFGASGRCVAAFGDHAEDSLEAQFKDLAWAEPLSYAEWQAQVEDTRAKGYAIDEGYHMDGRSFVAAPIFNESGRLAYTIVTSSKISALQKKGAAELEKAVADAARTMTRCLQKSEAAIDSAPDEEAGSSNHSAFR